MNNPRTKRRQQNRQKAPAQLHRFVNEDMQKLLGLVQQSLEANQRMLMQTLVDNQQVMQSLAAVVSAMPSQVAEALQSVQGANTQQVAQIAGALNQTMVDVAQSNARAAEAISKLQKPEIEFSPVLENAPFAFDFEHDGDGNLTGATGRIIEDDD